MKILMADNFHYVRGGAQRYFFELTELLESKGHKVIPFSVDYELNVKSDYDKYFVSSCAYSDIKTDRQTLAQKLKMGLNSVYSFKAKKRMRELIRMERPDVIHTHSIPYRLTSSIIDAAVLEGVPVVHTCHEWKALCPNQRLFRSNPPGICELCKGNKFYNAALSRCIKNSLSHSVLGSLEAYICHLRGTYSKKISRFIVPSRFVLDKVLDYGFDAERTDMVRYFIEIDKFVPDYSHDNYILYYGHLTLQKGVKTLISAMKDIPETTLKVIGSGELDAELKEMAAANVSDNIEFMDYMPGSKIYEYVKRAAFSIMPSVWFETGGLVIYESFALGKPVIAANMGPLPELVKDGETGLLFEPGNVEDLKEKINYLLANPKKIIEMGKNGRKLAEERLGSARHYEDLMGVYNKAIKKGNHQ